MMTMMIWLSTITYGMYVYTQHWCCRHALVTISYLFGDVDFGDAWSCCRLEIFAHQKVIFIDKCVVVRFLPLAWNAIYFDHDEKNRIVALMRIEWKLKKKSDKSIVPIDQWSVRTWRRSLFCIGIFRIDCDANFSILNGIGLTKNRKK